jgi:hypothetical protein
LVVRNPKRAQRSVAKLTPLNDINRNESHAESGATVFGCKEPQKGITFAKALVITVSVAQLNPYDKNKNF